jgi:hypothetical protein
MAKETYVSVKGDAAHMAEKQANEKTGDQDTYIVCVCVCVCVRIHTHYIYYTHTHTHNVYIYTHTYGKRDLLRLAYLRSAYA